MLKAMLKINTPIRITSKIGKSKAEAIIGPKLAPVNNVKEYNEMAEPRACSPNLPTRDIIEGKSNDIEATKGMLITAITPSLLDIKRQIRLVVAKLNPINNVRRSPNC